MFIIIISYRARGIQQFRREQIINTINNFKTFFEQNNLEYKIIISEQNNDDKFNRGLLLNVGFLESEKKHTFSKIYMHMNVDYTFNLSVKIPEELLNFKEGFVELYNVCVSAPILGSACAFDAESYKKSNGFPNDLEGWGGDDWAILHRIKQNNISLIQTTDLQNSHFVIEQPDVFDRTEYESTNGKNIELAQRNDFETNGLNSLKYTLDGYGEFHDGDTICHYLINN